MGQKGNASGGGGAGGECEIGRRRTSPRRSRRDSSTSSAASLAFRLVVLACCFFFSSSASASVLPSIEILASGGAETQQQLPEWPLEAVAEGELLNASTSARSSPVDVDELATWFAPQLVEETRKSVVTLSPVGRGLDIDISAGPAGGSGGILLDSQALLVGSRGKALNAKLAAAVPAGTRFVLTSRRAVSSGFADYEITLVDGRRATAKLVYVDAFYPVAVLVVVAEKEEEAATTAKSAVAAAAAVGSQKVDPASLPFATLYPPPEDDTRVIGSGEAKGETEESSSSTSSSSTSPSFVEPNDPLLFLGQSPERIISSATTTTTFVGYVSDLRAALPKSRAPGRGIRGVIARALVARKSPGPGGGAFDVSGRLFGLDVDRDVRGVVAAPDRKAEVYILPSIYLRDALARAVSASLKESLLVLSSSSSSGAAEFPFRRPRADGGFAATLIPLGIAADRYKLNPQISEMLRSDPRISGWPNAGGTVPKVIKVAGVDAGSESLEAENGIRAGDLVVGVVEEGDATNGGSVTRFLGDDLHALDDAFARAVARSKAAAAAAAQGEKALASLSSADAAGEERGWGEPATTTTKTKTASSSSSSSFLARPSPSASAPSQPEAAALSPASPPPAAAAAAAAAAPTTTVKLVVSRYGELLTVSVPAVELDASPAKPERVVVWSRCRFVDPSAASRRLYQFSGPGVSIASCDPESPLSAVVNADPREEDEAPTTTGVPPPSKTPVVLTSIGGTRIQNLGALVKLLGSKASPAGTNTTVAYRSIHTGRDSYAYVEGVSFAASDGGSQHQPFLEFVFSGRARSWVALAPPADGEEEEEAGGGKKKALSSSSSPPPPSSSASSSLLHMDAAELKVRGVPAKSGKGKASAAASVSASAFVSRGKSSSSSSSEEDPSDNEDGDDQRLLSLGKPSSLSAAEANDLLSLAAKALGKAPAHASQSVWGSPEALLRIKQQAVQISINDAIPLEHTDATPSAVGTGFVVEAQLGIIATNAHVCGPTIGGWEVMFFDGSTTPARQLWYSPSQDIAFLAVDPASIPFPNATATISSWKTISDADKPALGEEMEPVLTVGSPARFAFTLLQGVYLGASYRASDEVGKWRTRNYLKVRTLIQSVAGSSGGAVLNKRGEIVAIHFAGGSNSEFAAKYSASPYLWNSFEVAGDYVKRAVGFYKRLYGIGEKEKSGSGGASAGGVVIKTNNNNATATRSFLGRTEPIRGGSGLVLDLIPLENAVNFFKMPQSFAEEASKPDAPRPRSAMVVASFEPGSPVRSRVEQVLSPGDILWSVEFEGKEEKLGGDLIRLDELSGLAVEKALLAAGENSTSSSSSSLKLSVLRRGELLRDVALPVYDLTSDRVRRALSWNGALFHDVSDRTRNYYQLDDSSGGGGSGTGSGSESVRPGAGGVFASYRAEGAAWPRFYHPAAGGGSGKATTAFAKYLVYEVDGVATPDLEALLRVACSKKKKGNLLPPPTPAVVVARDLQDDSFPRGEAMESPVSQGGLTAVEPPKLFEWDSRELVWRQRAACV